MAYVPSFDVNEYMNSKVQQLNQTGSTHGGHTGQWTRSDVQNAFDTAGLTPQQHYQQYGKAEGVTPFEAQPKGPELFQPDLFPTSRSGSTSGIDFSNPYVRTMTGGILDRVGNLDNLTADSYNNAVSGARDVSRNQITGTTNNMLRSLANRGILNSGFAENAVGTALEGLAQGTQQNVYNAGLNRAQQEFNTPTMLAGLAQLGQRSTSSSLNEDRLAPYQSLMNFYNNMA